MQGKGRKRKRDPSTALSMLLKSINSPKRRRGQSFIVSNSRVNMSAALKNITCPVSQLDLLEPIGVQTEVDSFKDIKNIYRPLLFKMGPQSLSKLEKMNATQMLANL